MVSQAEFAKQREMDDLSIKALIEAGADSMHLHEIEHHFYSDSLHRLSKLTDSAIKLKYSVSTIESSVGPDGEEYYYVDVIGHAKINKDDIYRASKIMLGFADQFGIEYDGWGTKIKKRGSNPK